MLNISYLVTVHNEDRTLSNLLEKLNEFARTNDEIVIIDDFSDNPECIAVLSKYSRIDSVHLFQHALDHNYGGHKNFGIEQCKGDFIFQIDGDEMPPEPLLGDNINDIIESNPSIEAYAMPRINAWEGLTEAHAKQWGWSLDISPTYRRLRAAWPDYQFRIFKRDYPRIEFKKRLHERIEGMANYVLFPLDEEYALYHDKTIETQVATNLRYNKEFTTDENRGISDKK